MLHVLDSLEVGGMERAVLTLVKEQVRSGDTVQIACLFRLGPLTKELEAIGVKVNCFEKNTGFSFSTIKGLRQVVDDFAPGAIHTHNGVAHYYSALATLGTRLRIVNTRHDMGQHARTWKESLLYRLVRGRTAAFVGVCKTATNNFIHQGVFPATRSHSIPNAIEVDKHRGTSAGRKQTLAAELGLEVDWLIGSVGRLNKVKDLDTLLKGFAQVVGSGRTRVGLVIVGDGPEMQRLESLSAQLGIAKWVRFVGVKFDVERYYDSFDLFVQTSLTEGYSIALLEACASALPIVATDVGGNAEIVSDGTNGILMPSGSPDRVADAINRLLGNPQLMDRMGSAGRIWALANATALVMNRRYLELYRLS